MKIIVDELDCYECPYFSGPVDETYCMKNDKECEVREHRVNEIYDDDECIGLIEYNKFMNEIKKG